MTHDRECTICRSTDGATVRTYKHDWWTCRRCGTTRRIRRRKYPMARLVPRALASRVAPIGAIAMLYPDAAVVEDEHHRFDHYDTVSELEVSETKWAGQIEYITDRLREHDAGFEGREVLDISGGPGFMTAHFAAHGARRAIVTEFSQEAVEGMRRNLPIEVAKFDYQADRLRDVVDGMFDLVVIDYSINFCLDLGEFARSLTEILRPGGKVYVSWVEPTLGCFLRWQFDELMYNVLFRPETVDAAFADAGFTVQAKMIDPGYDYRSGLRGKERLLRDPFSLWYRARTPRRKVPFDRSLEQRGAARIYQLT